MHNSPEQHKIHESKPKNPIADNGISPSVTLSSAQENEKKTGADSATGKMLKTSAK